MTSVSRRHALKLAAATALTPGFAYLAACAQAAGAGESVSEAASVASAADASATSSATSAAPELWTQTTTYTLDNIRDYVVGIDEKVTLADGSQQAAICFDNAATTPALRPVLEEVGNKLALYGSIGRGSSQKSEHSVAICDEVRKKVLSFVGADPSTYTCFFVGDTTDGMNKLASALVTKDDVVLTTRMEHHSNDLPWRERCKVVYAEVDELGRIKYDDIERLLSENKVSYVTVTAASNVTGYVTDVHRVAKLAHTYGAKLIVDGAQIVAHRDFSMAGPTPEESVDFFVFSAHKMYAPFGGGAVVGLAEVLKAHMPQFYGGGIVRIVADDWVAYKEEAPAKYEAGSPNYPGIVSLGVAIDVLKSIGFEAIEQHEQLLMSKLIRGLADLGSVRIYGDTNNIADKVGVVTFNPPEVNTAVLAKRLAESYGFATRRGAFCAHPYVWRLMGIGADQLKGFAECTDVNTPGMVRVSFGIYNTEEEVDKFLAVMPEALEGAKKDAEKYSRAEPAY